MAISIDPSWSLKRQIRVAIKLDMTDTVQRLLPQADFQTSMALFLDVPRLPPRLWLQWSHGEEDVPRGQHWKWANTTLSPRGESAIFSRTSGRSGVVRPTGEEWSIINRGRPGRIGTWMGKTHSLPQDFFYGGRWTGRTVLMPSPEFTEQDFALATAKVDYLRDEARLLEGMELAQGLVDTPDLDRMLLELERVWDSMKIQLSYVHNLSEISNDAELDGHQSKAQLRAQKWIDEIS